MIGWMLFQKCRRKPSKKACSQVSLASLCTYWSYSTFNKDLFAQQFGNTCGDDGDLVTGDFRHNWQQVTHSLALPYSHIIERANSQHPEAPRKNGCGPTNNKSCTGTSTDAGPWSSCAGIVKDHRCHLVNTKTIGSLGEWTIDAALQYFH